MQNQQDDVQYDALIRNITRSRHWLLTHHGSSQFSQVQIPIFVFKANRMKDLNGGGFH